MTTCTAPTGSSTPPTCAAADRCTRFPICAHEPTRAWLSIIVSSPTYAPALTYIGGMHTTPGARYAPSRTLEPPGTMRTPSATVVGRTGYVSLSKKRKLACADISASAPIRKPARMPRLTQGLTLHTPDGSRSAARTSPRLSACLNDSKTSRSVELNSPPFANNPSTCSRSDMRQPLLLTRRQRTTPSRSRGDVRRLLQQPQLAYHLAHARAALIRDGHERQT